MRFGFDPIDDDHERLVVLASEVEALIIAGSPAGEIRAKFLELRQHSLAHFGREEAYMEASHYPALHAHRREHLELAEWLHHIEESLCSDPPTANDATDNQVIAFFEAWIDRHLRLLDAPAVRHVMLANQRPASLRTGR